MRLKSTSPADSMVPHVHSLDVTLGVPRRADYPVSQVADGQKREIWLEMHEGSPCQQQSPDDPEAGPAVQSM